MRKVIPLFLACIMVFMTACSGTTNVPANSATPSGSASASPSGEQTPSGPRKYTLIAKTDSNDGPWKDMYLFQYVQEKFGFELDITEIAGSVWTEKINIAFASNEYSDFFLNGLSETDRQTYGSQGIILDLNPYVTLDDTPNIYGIYQKYPELKQATESYDGNLYHIAGYDRTSVREYAQTRFFINKKWAENLGVKVPTNLDEFYTYLKAVKEGDADLDGDPNNEYPMSGSFENDPYSLLSPVLAAYGYALAFGTGSKTTYVDVIDGNVTYVPTQDNFKDILTYMHRLYQEELLDNEYFTQAKDQRDAKIASGKVATFVDHAQWLQMPDPEMYSEWDGLAPMTSDVNKTQIWAAADVKTLGQFVITDKCKDPKDLMRFADWSFTEEAYLTHLGGYEVGTVPGREGGYTLERYDPVNGINVIDMVYTVPEGYANESVWREATISPGWASIPVNRTEFLMGKPGGEGTSNETALDNAIVKNYTPYYKIGWPSSIKFSSAETDELSLIRADLDTYMRQMVSKFIVGEEDLANFDKFVAGCNDRNLTRYLEIYQAAYDRRMK